VSVGEQPGSSSSESKELALAWQMMEMITLSVLVQTVFGACFSICRTWWPGPARSWPRSSRGAGPFRATSSTPSPPERTPTCSSSFCTTWTTRAALILKNIQDGITPDGRLLILETVMPAGNE
jgi:hypothetical protein